MLGEKIFEYIDALAACSESAECLTRRSFTPEHRDAIGLVRRWMERAGMTVRLDAMGNLIGRKNSCG